MIDMITRTLSRYILSVSSMIGGSWIGRLAEGLAVEYSRLLAFRDKVYCAALPSDNLCPEAMDDLERKYGIGMFSDATSDERKARILERASLYASMGPDWLQDQIQRAGFPLWVVENNPALVTVQTQFGDQQFDQTTQFGIMPDRVDPSSVEGALITSSANDRGGFAASEFSQFGSVMQFGDAVQFGSPDSKYAYPLPTKRVLPTNPAEWGRIFFLSPVEGRLATESEMLYLSEDQIAYLTRLVTQLKPLRMWCIAQVATRVVITDVLDGAVLTFEDGSLWTA